MKHLEIRYQKVSDAKRFLEILSHPDFIYFPVKPKDVEEQKVFLRQNREKRRSNTEYNFSIIYKGTLVGAVGIKIDQHRKHIGEIGYFIDHDYWNKGIASGAVELVEEFAFNQLQLTRIEIVTLEKNIASQRVAEKCGYQKEGIQKGKLLFNGEYLDAHSYAKTT
ncbi:MAG: GNAT family N-acetyltransferase [Chloroflexota bacterium]|nr:GNAT family N-acetyltransferase [Chloroflexota bacterium]